MSHGVKLLTFNNKSFNKIISWSYVHESCALESTMSAIISYFYFSDKYHLLFHLFFRTLEASGTKNFLSILTLSKASSSVNRQAREILKPATSGT